MTPEREDCQVIKSWPLQRLWFASFSSLSGPYPVPPAVKGLNPVIQRCLVLLGGSLEWRVIGGRAFGEQQLHHCPLSVLRSVLQGGLTSAEGVQ